jgi:hypothetical protein
MKRYFDRSVEVPYATYFSSPVPQGRALAPVEAARDADASTTGIALSTVAANYQTCHENAEQLRALRCGWEK